MSSPQTIVIFFHLHLLFFYQLLHYQTLPSFSTVANNVNIETYIVLHENFPMDCNRTELKSIKQKIYIVGNWMDHAWNRFNHGPVSPMQ